MVVSVGLVRASVAAFETAVTVSAAAAKACDSSAALAVAIHSHSEGGTHPCHSRWTLHYARPHPEAHEVPITVEPPDHL